MHAVFVAQCLCLSLESLGAIDPLIAQTDMPESAKAELGKLPAVEQAVIRQLSTLDLLRQPQWKMHTAADLPHGKALDLDDLSWHVMTAPPEGTADAGLVPRLDRGP